MAKAVGIEKQAVLVGMLDRFEIWNPERQVKVQTADEVMAPEAFRMME
jgi:DNA-binding transcriptional regulator/RsmH inhibitor MraZ